MADPSCMEAVKEAAVAEMDRGFAILDAASKARTGCSATGFRWSTSISSHWRPGIPKLKGSERLAEHRPSVGQVAGASGT